MTVLLCRRVDCVAWCTVSVDPEKFQNDLTTYMVSGVKPESFMKRDNFVKFPRMFRRDSRDDTVNQLVCVICDSVADAAIVARRLGTSKESIQSTVEELCIDLDIETEEVCHGVIDLNIVSDARTYYIIINHNQFI